MIAYNVTLNGKRIDTVFYTETDRRETIAEACDSVRRSLIGHDGYDPAIVVTRARPSRVRPYVGIAPDGSRSIVRAPTAPTAADYGDRYTAMIGPFHTVRGARYFVDHRYSVHTVRAAETLAERIQY